MADETPTPDVKPGYKTTEFWLSTAAILIGVLYGSGFIHPEGADTLSKAVGFISAALGALGYSISRGITKKS